MADVEQDLEKIAEKEKLVNWKTKLRNYAIGLGETTLNTITFRKRQKDKNVQISSKAL